MNETVQLSSSSSSTCSQNELSDEDTGPSTSQMVPPKRRRSSKKVLDSNCVAIGEDIKKSFKPSVPLTVHWDGKIVPAVNGGPAVDSLPVLVSGDGVEKLLAVPNLPNGTGETTANAVEELRIE